MIRWRTVRFVAGQRLKSIKCLLLLICVTVVVLLGYRGRSYKSSPGVRREHCWAGVLVPEEDVPVEITR